MLITTRLAFLQAVQKAAIAGYYFYTVGSLSIEKLPNLMKRLEKAYAINLTRQQAYRLRQKGRASAKFFCYADETDITGQKVFFVLMFTLGETCAHERERLKDLRLKHERFCYSDYELIQKPNQKNKLKFTFHLKTTSFAFYQQKIRQTIRNKNSGKINTLMTHLSMMPGFSEIRKQKKRLQQILKGELKRAFTQEQVMQFSKMTNFYHRQQKMQSVKRIGTFIAQMKQYDCSVKQQLKRYRTNRRRRERS